MTAFTWKFTELAWLNFQAKDIAKILWELFNPANSEDLEFLISSVGGYDDGYYYIDWMLREMDNEKKELLIKNTDFITKLNDFIEQKIDLIKSGNSYDPIYHLLCVARIVFGDDSNYFEKYFDADIFCANPDNLYSFFVRTFASIDNKDYFIEALRKYLKHGTSEYWFIHVYSFIPNYINNRFDSLNFSDLFQFILSELKEKNLRPLAFFSKFNPEDINAFFEKVTIDDEEIWKVVRELFYDIFSVSYEEWHTSFIHDYEKDVLQSEFILRMAISLSRYDKDIVFELYKQLVSSEHIYIYDYEFGRICKNIGNIESAQKVWDLIRDNPEKYSSWHIFYDAIDSSSLPEKDTIITALYEKIPTLIDNRNAKIEAWRREEEAKNIAQKKEFEENVNMVLEELSKKPDTFSSWLLQEYFEHIVNPKQSARGSWQNTFEILASERVKSSIESQLNNFFSTIDFSQIQWKITEKHDWWSSYSTAWVIVYQTYKQSILIAKSIWFDLSLFRKPLIELLPFCYHEEAAVVFDVLWIISDAEIAYLIWVYNWSRKDDLKYHNFMTFLNLLQREWILESLNIHSKEWIRKILLDSILDLEYGYSERLSALEVFVSLYSAWDEDLKKALLELRWILSQTNANYFNDYLPISWNYDEEQTKWELFLKINRYLIEKYKEITAIDWIILQLLEWKPSLLPHSNDGRMRRVTNLESEISWHSDSEEKMTYSLRFICDASYASKINELLKHAFNLIREWEEYKAYAQYLFYWVFWFYDGLDEAAHSLYIDLKEVMTEFDSEQYGGFLNFFSKLAEKWWQDISSFAQVIGLQKKIEELEKKNTELVSASKEESFNNSQSKINDSIILFVEWKTDKFHIEKAWYTLRGNMPPFVIVPLGGCSMIWAALRTNDPNDKTMLYIGLFDHDGFNEMTSIMNRKKDEKWELNNRRSEWLFIAQNAKPSNKYALLIPTNYDTTDIDLRPQVYFDDENKTHLWPLARFDLEHLFYSCIPTDKKMNYFSEDLLLISNYKYLRPIEGEKMKGFRRLAEDLQIPMPGIYKNFERLISLIEGIIAEWQKDIPISE